MNRFYTKKTFYLLMVVFVLLGFTAGGSGQAQTAETTQNTGQSAGEDSVEAPGERDSRRQEIVTREQVIQLGVKSARMLMIFFFGWLLYLLLKAGIARLNRSFSDPEALRETDVQLRVRTLAALAYWLGTLLIAGVVLYMCLENLGFNLAPLLAGAGIVGLAFGFGGQYLIRDVINGIFILLEGQYHINDVVKIGELAGLVENVNLRLTRLRDLEGRVIYIPNGEIKSVINFTKEWSRALFDIGVAYKEDPDKVIEVIKAVGREMREDPHFGRLILDELEMLGVNDFGDSQVTIKFFIKTLPIKQWEVGREFRRRLKKRFDREGIEIPFPHRTLYWGAGADNDWMRHFFQSGGSSGLRPEG